LVQGTFLKGILDLTVLNYDLGEVADEFRELKVIWRLMSSDPRTHQGEAFY